MNPNALIDLLEIANKQIDTQSELIKMLEEKIQVYQDHINNLHRLLDHA
jgi:hypothetical protein